MKKVLIIGLSLTFLLMTACGSGGGAAPASEHPHTAVDWSADHQNHWRSCPDCGTEYDKAAHTIRDDSCTECGAEIVTDEQGATYLTVYNSYGDCTLYAYYDADGNLGFKDVNEYSYSADGKKQSQRSYNDDVLASEIEFSVSADGQEYISKACHYSEDGTYDISEQDEDGNTLLWVSYAADGSEENRNEYEYSADRNKMTERSYYQQQLQYQSVYDITDGDQILLSNTTYYADGGIEGSEYDKYGNAIAYFSKTADGIVESEYIFEHEYDDEGRITLTKTFENGRLTHEQEYINGSDEEGSWSRSGKNISYHADGSKTVCDADPDGAWSSEITYDAAGNVTEELRYEYEYNENGDQTVGRSYENGRLTETMEAIADENGETEFIIRTKYLEDGGRQVRKADTNFDVVEETDSDASGNVIN
ncbi:MAG: hypothetical protein IJF25_06065 [Oscillospiraceae bacterium]|nr:hypothetical protein [Oscillospiraceae bacterium]